MVSNQPPKRRTFQTLIIWSLILVAVYIIIWQIISRSTKAVDIPYSIFLHELRNNNVYEVTMTERSIKGKFRSSISIEGEEAFTDFATLIPFDDPKLAEELVEHNVKVVAKQKSGWGSILIGIVPWLLLIGVWIFFIRQMQSGQNRALGFGRSFLFFGGRGQIGIVRWLDVFVKGVVKRLPHPRVHEHIDLQGAGIPEHPPMLETLFRE